MKFKVITSSLLVLAVVTSSFLGCSNKNVSSNSSNTVNYANEMKKYTIGEYGYLDSYVKSNNIELNTFSDKDKVLKVLNELNSEKNMVYLTTDSHLLSEDNYKVTKEQSNIIYCGEIKDNKPNGIGAIFEVKDGKNFIKYVGNFKKGIFEGYGMLFNVPTDDEFYYANIIYNNDEDKAIKRSNYLVFDGEFEDGQANGKGNYYVYLNLQTEMYLVQDGKPKSTDIGIYVGKFEIDNNGITGEGKEYQSGYLYYDGEFKNSSFNGDGILYFEKSKQKEYEGSFRNGKYNGKGTLYDETGKVIYSGKWDMGDYK